MYASAVAAQCKVPLEAVSMQKEYFDLVVGHTVAEAARGRTPNPDILCNRCLTRDIRRNIYVPPKRIRRVSFYSIYDMHLEPEIT